MQADDPKSRLWKKYTHANNSEVSFPTSVLGCFYSTPESCSGLNCVLEQDKSKYKPSVPVNVILFGNRVFSVDVIKLRWGHTQLGWNPIQMTGVLIRRKLTQTTQEQPQVISEAKTGTLGIVGNTKAKRRAWNRFFSRALKQNMVLMTLWCRTV